MNDGVKLLLTLLRVGLVVVLIGVAAGIVYNLVVLVVGPPVDIRTNQEYVRFYVTRVALAGMALSAATLLMHMFGVDPKYTQERVFPFRKKLVVTWLAFSVVAAAGLIAAIKNKPRRVALGSWDDARNCLPISSTDWDGTRCFAPEELGHFMEWEYLFMSGVMWFLFSGALIVHFAAPRTRAQVSPGDDESAVGTG